MFPQQLDFKRIDHSIGDFMAKQSLASILANKKKPQKFADGGLDADTKSMLSQNPMNPQYGLGPVYQSTNLGSAGQGQTLSSNMSGILTAGSPNMNANASSGIGNAATGSQGAGPSGYAGSWGNVNQLPAYSAAQQQAAFNLNLQPQQNQINQGYATAGQTAGNAASFTQALQNQALGNTPSLATAQLQQAQNQSLAQQLGAAAAARGGNAASTQRTLAQNQALSGQQLGQQAAITQIQNQQALANAATNAQNAQTQQQQLQQSYINQGMTAQQAQQQASSSYMNYATEQQQSAAAQEAAIQAAQLGANASVASANIGSTGNTLWHYIGLKDGGPVEVQKPSSFASAISKQIYPRKDSYTDLFKGSRPVRAADGNAGMGIQPIASLSGNQQQSAKPVAQQNPAIPGVSPREANTSNPGVSPVLNSAKSIAALYGSNSSPVESDIYGTSQNSQLFNSGYDSTAAAGAEAEGGEGLASLLAANGGMMYRKKFDDGGQAMLGANYDAPLVPNVEQTDLQIGGAGSAGGSGSAGAGSAGGSGGMGLMGGAAAGAAIGSVVPGIGTVAGAIGGAILGGLGFKDGGYIGDGGAQYAPSEQELRVARNLTRDVLVPQFANGGIAKPIWRGPGIPETSESVSDIGTGIPKPVWRGPGIPETFESSYGSVLAARRQLKR